MSEKDITKFPIASSDEYLKDKAVDYKTLSLMTLYSNLNPPKLDQGIEEFYRYLYRNKLTSNQEEIEQLSNAKMNTILKNVKRLTKLENRLVTFDNTEHGIVYYINYTNELGVDYVTIPEDMLKFLINTSNSNTIKTYILMKYMCRDKGKIMTREYIAGKIGLSAKSHNSLLTISHITKSLENNHFIKKKVVYNTHTIDGREVTKQSIEYSVVEREEWKQLNNFK